jgi:hypothetical protein
VPADLDRQETRVMPKTPPVTYAASRPTVNLPPLPGTPVPPTTRIGTPPPLPAGPVTAPPPGRKRPGWLKWVGIGLAGYFIFGRSHSRPKAPEPESSPAPAGVAKVADEDQGAKDRRLRAEVVRTLNRSPRIRDEPIVVDVDEGEVSLRGRASSKEVVEEADALARTVEGVTDVSNEVEVPDPEDHAVPEAVPVPNVHPVPPVAGVGPSIEMLQRLTKEIPVKQLVRAGLKQLEAGQAEAALQTFTAALSLDPNNKDAAHGARDAGRMIREQERRRLPSPPPPPTRPPSPGGNGP